MKRFAAIPERMKAAARREVEAEALAMVDEMQRGAPVEDGELRDSIRAVDQSTDTWIRWRVKAGGPLTQRTIKTAKGSSRIYDYARGIEHGTSKSPAQPFFWPTSRRRRRRFRAKLRREMAKAAKAE